MWTVHPHLDNDCLDRYDKIADQLLTGSVPADKDHKLAAHCFAGSVQ